MKCTFYVKFYNAYTEDFSKCHYVGFLQIRSQICLHSEMAAKKTINMFDKPVTQNFAH